MASSDFNLDLLRPDRGHTQCNWTLSPRTYALPCFTPSQRSVWGSFRRSSWGITDCLCWILTSSTHQHTELRLPVQFIKYFITKVKTSTNTQYR